MAALGAVLVRSPAAELDVYTRDVAISTAAAAVREALQRMAPTFDVDGLVLDLAGATAGGEFFDVWLTEPDVGSGGTVEALRQTVGEDPIRLLRLIGGAIGPTDFEIVDRSVRRLLHIASDAEDVGEAFNATRTAETAAASAEAQRLLRGALRRHGITADHGVLSTLNLRVLRPGSDAETDEALANALSLWDEAESRLGIEFDARCIAYSVSKTTALTLEQIYSLLWPHGRDARAAGLEAYSRYGELARPERLVLAALLSDVTPTVQLGQDARQSARELLARGGPVSVAAASDSGPELREFLARLVLEPVDVGSVSGYPRIIGATRADDHVSVMVELSEAML